MPGTIATFGTGHTNEQVLCISKRFKRAFLAYDPEPAAQKTAEEMAWALGMKGVEVTIIEPDPVKDTWDIPQDEADI